MGGDLVIVMEKNDVSDSESVVRPGPGWGKGAWTVDIAVVGGKVIIPAGVDARFGEDENVSVTTSAEENGVSLESAGIPSEIVVGVVLIMVGYGATSVMALRLVAILMRSIERNLGR